MKNEITAEAARRSAWLAGQEVTNATSSRNIFTPGKYGRMHCSSDICDNTAATSVLSSCSPHRVPPSHSFSPWPPAHRARARPRAGSRGKPASWWPERRTWPWRGRRGRSRSGGANLHILTKYAQSQQKSKCPNLN